MYVNKWPSRCNYTHFILSVNCSTCFGWFLRPSSGTQTTLSTASGTGQPLLVQPIWNVMAHAQKPDLVFQRKGRVHLNWRGVSVQSTTGSRGVRISSSNGSNAGYTIFWGRVQDYWLPIPFDSFPFTSPPVRHGVPSGVNWALPVVIGVELRLQSRSLNSTTIAIGWPVPDVADTVICVADDGWRDHPKHIEQFTYKINSV